MNYQHTCAPSPLLSATRFFYAHDSEPCTLSRFAGLDWYHGTGVPPQAHPARHFALLREDLPNTHCGHCGQARVRVIALLWRVIFGVGRVSYDYEVVCLACGHFTAFARCRERAHAPIAARRDWQPAER